MDGVSNDICSCECREKGEVDWCYNISWLNEESNGKLPHFSILTSKPHYFSVAC